jgi:hypothetical protein
MELFKKKTIGDMAIKNEEYLKKLNEKTPLFVPYEVFKQAMEVNGENLKEIYSMMHTINMERPYCVEMNAGDFGFSVSGPKEDMEKISKVAQEMTDAILKKVFSKDAMKLLVKKPPEKENVRDQNYA